MRLLDRKRTSIGAVAIRPPRPRVAGPVASTWRQWPTVQPGGAQRVIGTVAHQDWLIKVGKGRAGEGVRNPLVTARLLMNEDDQGDLDVLVELDGRLVGALPRPDAPGLQRCLRYMAQSGEPASCRAWITRTWERHGNANNVEEFSIVLDLDRRHLPRQPDCPFLPSGSPVSVQRTEHHTELLQRFLASRRHVNFTAELRESATDPHSPASNERVLLVYGGHQLLGALAPRIAEAYLPLVREVTRAGFGATCLASLSPGADRYVIELDITPPESAG